MFWSNVLQDHSHAALIWNERTRAELRESLEAERKELKLGRMRVADGSGGYPSWNYEEFQVEYPSLSRHLCIGSIFVRLLLESVEQGEHFLLFWTLMASALVHMISFFPMLAFIFFCFYLLVEQFSRP